MEENSSSARRRRSISFANQFFFTKSNTDYIRPSVSKHHTTYHNLKDPLAVLAGEQKQESECAIWVFLFWCMHHLNQMLGRRGWQASNLHHMFFILFYFGLDNSLKREDEFPPSAQCTAPIPDNTRKNGETRKIEEHFWYEFIVITWSWTQHPPGENMRLRSHTPLPNFLKTTKLRPWYIYSLLGLLSWQFEQSENSKFSLPQNLFPIPDNTENTEKGKYWYFARVSPLAKLMEPLIIYRWMDR